MGIAPKNSVHPKTRAAWRDWLVVNHEQTKGVWFVNYKKTTSKSRLEYDEAVEEALCFGWIDSKPKKLDDERSMLWFAPRKSGSWWPKINKERVERMIAAGKMTPAGMAKVEAAKQDGSWTALDAIEALEIPPDLVSAFYGYDSARTHFDAFPRSIKRSILEWIPKAKNPETRAKRSAKTAWLAEENIRANQWRR